MRLRWRCRDRVFDLDQRPLVMGVLNVTPDSFSDGGRYLGPEAAVEHARAMLAAGADLLDVGAESTRPGSQPVPTEEQWRRLEPVLEQLRGEPGACLSVDTASAEVARRALELGIRVVNDITALGDPVMAGVVAAAGAGLVLVHMQGTPATMQEHPTYDDAPGEIARWLGERIALARHAGVADECVALDPGIGFGKLLRHNLELLARLDELVAMGRPVLVGVSRKSFIGKLLDLPVEDRLEGGLAAEALAVFQGAAIVRTHEVRATQRAIAIAAAVRGAKARAHR